MEKTLSPKQVAAALGASESSLKRWTDTGQLEAVRTPGGHRRIAVREAVRFARESEFQIVRPEVLGLPELTRSPQHTRQRSLDDQLGQTLYDCLQRGDGPGARALIIQSYLDGHSVAAICDGPLRYALDRLGELWHHNQTGVFIEHRATDLVIQALNQLRPLLGPAPAEPTDLSAEPGRSAGRADPAPADAGTPEGRDQADADLRGKAHSASADTPMIAVGGAPAGDPYMIPSLAAACVLADVGFQSVNLGPDTPDSVLLDAVEHHGARLAWLSCSASRGALPDAAALHALAERLVDHHATLVIGGGQIEHLPAVRHPNLHFGRSMAELAAFAHGLLTR